MSADESADLHPAPSAVVGAASEHVIAPRRAFVDALERNAFLISGLGVVAVVQIHFLRTSIVSDSWYSLVSGRTVSDSGLPRHDHLTVFTLGRDWIDQQWLAHLAVYGLWSVDGWRLVLLAGFVLFFGSFLLLAVTARCLGASDRAAAVCVLGCYAVGLSNSALRAQTLAYPLFAGIVALLVTDARAQSRRVYLVLPLLALWANVHGSVILGAGLVALRGVTVAGAGLRRRSGAREWVPRATALLVLPWACLFASPYRLDLIDYYRSVLGNSGLRLTVSEWAPSTVTSAPAFFALLLVAVWLVARAHGATTWFERLALAGTGILGLYAERYIVWFALAGAVVLPLAVDAVWRPSAAPRRVRINVALSAVGLIAPVVALAAVAAHRNSWFEHDYPPRAATAVAEATRSDPGLRVFANERYADWLLFAHPELEGRVAFDVRFELLSQEQLAQLVAFRHQKTVDWQAAARGYGLLVLDPTTEGGTIAFLERARHARVLFSDGDVVVLQRR